MINEEVHNKRVKICWNKGSIVHTIICIYILYGFCIQIVYIMVMDVHFLYIKIHVYKMSTKCLYTKSIPHFHNLLYTFCIQNVYKMLHSKCIPHFDKLLYTFWIQNLADIVLSIVEMWYTFCIPQLCIYQLNTSCTIFV